MSKKLDQAQSSRNLRAQIHRAKLKKYKSEDDVSQGTSGIAGGQSMEMEDIESLNIERDLSEDHGEMQSADSNIADENVNSSEQFIDVEKTSDFGDDDRFSDDDCACTSTDDSDEEDIGWHPHQRSDKVIDDLRKWSFQSNTTGTSLDDLLKLLHPRMPDLPLCGKTLRKRRGPPRYKIKDFNSAHEIGSKFVYFGMTEQLQRLVNPDIHNTKILKLQFNVDGLPLYKSSPKEFWPILGKVFFEPDVYEPFVIAVYCGAGKPKCVKEYLDEFVTELNQLLENGIVIEKSKFDVECMCFICDKPARSFLKGTKGHTGFYVCERCTVQGIRHERRTIYPSTDCEKRTDTSFRNEENKEHHIPSFKSPLLGIKPPIDMISRFVLDFMHLCCLGVMKKLLVDYWLNTSTSFLCRQSILRVSQRMINLSSQIPFEFQRTTRSLGEIAKWKATKFRFFYYTVVLLY